KLEYACRVVVQLANCYDGEHVCRVEDLAKREGLSPSFLVQILNDLRRGGIVVSKRGKMGGYSLAKPPDEITLTEVVIAMEGEVLGMDSDQKGESGPRIVTMWKEVMKAMESKMSAITLAD